MLLSPKLQAQQNSQDNSFSKLWTSLHTAATSKNLCNNIMSLPSCCSSVSLDEDQQGKMNKEQRRVMMKYLMLHEGDQKFQDFLGRMRKIYDRRQIQESEEENQLNLIVSKRPNKFVKESDGEMTAYFFCRWLKKIGYKSDKNRQLIIQRAHIVVQNNKFNMHDVIRFYEGFGSVFISQEQKWTFVEMTCKNGWEYFSHNMIKFIEKKAKDKK